MQGKSGGRLVVMRGNGMDGGGLVDSCSYCWPEGDGPTHEFRFCVCLWLARLPKIGPLISLTCEGTDFLSGMTREPKVVETIAGSPSLKNLPNRVELILERVRHAIWRCAAERKLILFLALVDARSIARRRETWPVLAVWTRIHLQARARPDPKSRGHVSGTLPVWHRCGRQ
ncbi:hypothetical protein BC826DRAFT_78785 [Russula brevipes]|nr:hypothetical protein BC826DRAFT_78785 [Russula brevipes]